MGFSRSWSDSSLVIHIIHRQGIPLPAFQAARSCWLLDTADAWAVSSELIKVRGRGIRRMLRRARVVTTLGTQHYFLGGLSCAIVFSAVPACWSRRFASAP